MASLNQFLSPSISRPVHMTLTEPRSSLRSLFRATEDPYHNKSSYHQREDVFSPSFDVRESDSAFFLEGEFPGVGGKEDIMIEKLGPRTLLVESNVTRFDVEAEWGQPAVATLSTVQSEKAEQKHSHGILHREQARKHTDDQEDKSKYPSAEQKEERGKEDGLQSKLLERHVGYLQRSFTFPSPVDIDGLKARLRSGLLIIMVPKATDEREVGKKIVIEG